MPRYITINSSSRKRKKTIKKKLTTGPVTLAIITVILFCVLGMLFLAQVFQSQTKSYETVELNKKAAELKTQNRELEIKTAELRSITNIEKSAKQLNLVKTKNIVYINRMGNSVVVVNK